jgi:hypothetical protein
LQRPRLSVRVVADCLEPHEIEILAGAIRILNGLQAEFWVCPEVRSTRLPANRFLLLNQGLDLLDRKQKTKQERIVCVTNLPFRDDLFQDTHTITSIISIRDWENSFAPPSLKIYLIYQFAFAFAVWSAFHAGGNLPSHKPETIGCRMDYCDEKYHLKLGMFAGRLCGQCREALLQSGAMPRQLGAIQKILDFVRLAALGSEPRIDWNSAFVLMRFTEGDENQRAYEQGICPGLSDVGVQPLRGDDVVESRQILEKITEMIKQSRFVVAKIDEERMNVYYELGLAMGLEKDFLLVSEKGFRAPSDLSNWERLTYNRGDYAQLRKGIAQFFIDNHGRTRRRRASDN